MGPESTNPRDMLFQRHPAASFRAALVVVCLGAALLAGGAAAADKARNPPPAKNGGAVLTPAQLRDCMAQKERLHKDTDSALKAKADIAADKAEIDRTGNALSEQAAMLDRTSSEAVDAYNGKVDERDKLIATYQAKVAAYNKDTEAVLAAKDGYEKSCENRRYDDRDLLDLQRKK
jgi:hypothetical protein